MFQNKDQLDLLRIRLIRDLNDIEFPNIQQITYKLIQKLQVCQTQAKKPLFDELEFQYISTLIHLQQVKATLEHYEDVKFRDV